MLIKAGDEVKWGSEGNQKIQKVEKLYDRGKYWGIKFEGFGTPQNYPKQAEPGEWKDEN
jgi:hypothetical protein